MLRTPSDAAIIRSVALGRSAKQTARFLNIKPQKVYDTLVKHKTSAKKVRYNMRSTKDRFMEKVDKLETGCWLWTGSRTARGYGRFHWADAARPVKAHRASWALFRASYSFISSSDHVLHKCNNPSCVNPDHLYIGTPQDNMHDAIAAGAIKRTNPQLVFKLAKKGYSCIEIGQMLNITKQAVSKIAQRHGLSVRRLRRQASSQTEKLPTTTQT